MIPLLVLPSLGTLKSFLCELSFNVSIRYSQAGPVLGHPCRRLYYPCREGARGGGEEGEL